MTQQFQKHEGPTVKKGFVLDSLAGATLMAEEALADGSSREEAYEISYSGMVYTMLHRWWEQKRPFFNVHRSVVDALQNTKVHGIAPKQIPKSVLHRLGVVEVRVPSSTGEWHPFFIGLVPVEIHANNLGVRYSGEEEYQMEVFSNVSGTSWIMQSIPWDTPPNTGPTGHGLSACSDEESEIITKMLHLAYGILMLAADPDYLEPVLIAKDKRRNLSGDSLERAIERARNRGLHGYDIGMQVETSPHFRRPHFALRWTGAGRKIPRLVPVKGCFVGRDKVSKIPTGYEDTEGVSL